jgi:hypothetical protein
MVTHPTLHTFDLGHIRHTGHMFRRKPAESVQSRRQGMM